MELAKRKMIREFGSSFIQSFTVASTLLLAALYIFVHPAIAQTVAAPSGGVDFTPLASQVIAAVTVVLGVAASVLTKFAVSWISSKTKMNDNALEKLMADRVDDVLHRAIDYAVAWSKTQVADPNSPLKHVQIDNFFLRQAVDYAVRSMPDLIKYFNLTEARIADMIRSRLNAHMDVPKVDSGIVKTTLAAPDAPAAPATATDLKDLAAQLLQYQREGGSIATAGDVAR